MKKLNLFNNTEIEVDDVIYDQLSNQWYKNNECIEESKSSYDFYNGGNFFDIGAFNGIYSYIFAPKAEKNNFFISFEPDSRFLNLLAYSLENLSRNYSYINYKVINTPVGDGESINYNLPNRGPNGEVGNPCFFGDSKCESAHKTITIDKFVEDTNIIPTIIKIDVEGAELNVLKGCQKTLLKYKPKIILEIHSDFLIKNFNINPSEVINFIEKYNYKENLIFKNKNIEKILYFE
jgi:FkbM family methyltransferase